MPVKALADIHAGTSVYVDANILVYALLGKGQQCEAFVRRLASDLDGYTDVKVLHDCAHKLMLAEASSSAKNLKGKPDHVRGLAKWQEHFRVLRAIPIEVASVSTTEIDKVPFKASREGLLCGDALIRVCMEECGLTAIATNDSEFARLPIDVFRPSDV
jgi:predicted nucleic acid-binding protein